jgi:hypothetical protein
MLLILFTTEVPDSVQTLKSSTVTLVANDRSLATRKRGGRLAPSATDPRTRQLVFVICYIMGTYTGEVLEDKVT